MSKEKDSVLRGAMSSQEQSQRVLQDLIAAAQARSVFGEPVTHGEYAVITASEVTVGLGFGFGMGSGSSSAEAGRRGCSEWRRWRRRWWRWGERPPGCRHQYRPPRRKRCTGHRPHETWPCVHYRAGRYTHDAARHAAAAVASTRRPGISIMRLAPVFNVRSEFGLS